MLIHGLRDVSSDWWCGYADLVMCFNYDVVYLVEDLMAVLQLIPPDA